MIGGDRGLIAGHDGEKWKNIRLCHMGIWIADTCALMPTVCRLLKSDPAVSGRISAEAIMARNAARNWTTATAIPTQLPEWISTLDKRKVGAVPNLQVRNNFLECPLRFVFWLNKEVENVR